MNKRKIETDTAPGAIGPYSQAVVCNGLAFLSGQIPIDPASGEIVEGGIGLQTERVLENLSAVLDAAGAGLENVLKTTVYLRDMNDFQEMNATYARFFPGVAPARAAIQAGRLPKDVAVEIDAIAWIGD